MQSRKIASSTPAAPGPGSARSTKRSRAWRVTPIVDSIASSTSWSCAGQWPFTARSLTQKPAHRLPARLSDEVGDPVRGGLPASWPMTRSRPHFRRRDLCPSCCRHPKGSSVLVAEGIVRAGPARRLRRPAQSRRELIAIPAERGPRTPAVGNYTNPRIVRNAGISRDELHRCSNGPAAATTTPASGHPRRDRRSVNGGRTV